METGVLQSLRTRVFELVEAGRDDDPASLRCDLFLIALITVNVLAAILESVPSIGKPHREVFQGLELLSVVVFSIEYLVRLWCCVASDEERFQHPVFGRLRYARSPMALIDLAAILPFYAAALVPVDLRFMRVLRILRILKLSHYFSALAVLLDVVRKERHAFGAAGFLLTIGILFASSGIYVFEHEVQPVAFGSIPAAMWWAVATLTTVGYGDVTPITDVGKIFGASVTVIGVGMVVLPAGILASGFGQEMERRRNTYETSYDDAMADGVIDEFERADLERLRQKLGLSEEVVAQLRAEQPVRRAEPLPPPAAAASDKCPHCGEWLAEDANAIGTRPG